MGYFDRELFLVFGKAPFFDLGYILGLKKTIFLSLAIISFSLSAQESTISLSGTVTDYENRPLEGVSITLKGTLEGAQTDKRGFYEIDVKVADTLVFSHVGMHTKQIAIEDHIDRLNVQLFINVQELDEVQVKKRRVKTQKDLLAEYPTNKNLIKTSRGILDKDRTSFSMRIVDGDQILPTGNDFLTSLRSHFPNMVVHRDTTPPRVYLWNPGSINNESPPPAAIFDVDGIIYEQTPTWLIPSEIDRIAVMKRNGAFKYGPQGAGGVIIINTKEKTRIDELDVERVYNNRGLVDSLTKESNKPTRYTPKKFDFIEKYEEAKSRQKAWTIFNEDKENHLDSPVYFFETSRYFLKRWQDETNAIAILEMAKQSFADNVAVRKAIAYFLEEMGQYGLALQHYLDILKLRSSAAQSNRDVANAQNEVGDYTKALLRYARYEKAIVLFDSIAFDPFGADLLISVETNNILRQRRKELDISENQINKELEVATTRVLLEWNLDDFEFEIQLTDPEDLFVLWNNYDKSTPEMEMAQKKGYSSKQFFLDDSLEGDWKLNLNYRYEENKVPAVLKVTTFLDYGLPTQKSESKVFRLYDLQSSFHLATIDTSGKKISF
ncbi:carboxypeptidase-like regulatory domain-containing protein [Maribacter algicola]|uniref:Carboxypeptidase-like regulatory domain-containing protein n=1 Tax=Meishania litoralis TaxID=3434685 RepID=A0ACC7LLH6_9FLAO